MAEKEIDSTSPRKHRGANRRRLDMEDGARAIAEVEPMPLLFARTCTPPALRATAEQPTQPVAPPQAEKSRRIEIRLKSQPCPATPRALHPSGFVSGMSKEPGQLSTCGKASAEATSYPGKAANDV
jgi:hypothetical protein